MGQSARVELLSVKALEEVHESRSYVYSDERVFIGFARNAVVVDDVFTLKTHVVFCASRKQAERLARAIAELLTALQSNADLMLLMRAIGEKLKGFEYTYHGVPRLVYAYALIGERK